MHRGFSPHLGSLHIVSGATFDELDFEYATTVAESAMRSMAQQRVPPTPNNFHLWFKYALGSASDLKRAVDILVSNKRKFDKTTNQALFDTYVQGLDDALREMGVGDLSVGKKMRKLGEAFYGRVKSYEAAFEALPDAAALQALIARTVYAQGDAALAGGLSDYVVAERASLAAAQLEPIVEGRSPWATP